MKNRIQLISIGLILGIILAIPVLGNNFFDDAYIHARLARNITTYGSPAFNPGDNLKIGSSTGFVYLISALSIFFDYITAIKVIEFFTISITTAGFFLLISLLGKVNKILVALSFISIFPYFLHSAYGGMETPIVCMLILFSIIAVYYKEYALSIFLISFSTWFRFELILLLLLTGASFSISNKVTKKQLLLYCTPFTGLVIFELSIYGTIIPHAAKVKQISYGFPLPHSIYNALSFGLGSTYTVIGISFTLFFALHIYQLIKRRFDTDFGDVLIIFSAGVFAAWAVGRSLIFPWYYCLFTFPFGLQLIRAHQARLKFMALKEDTPKLFNTHLHAITCMGLAFLGLSIVFSVWGPYSKDYSSKRVGRYLEIGSALFKTCPTCTMVTSEIGGLGYSFEGIVYDGFGLGDPAATRYHPMKVPDERQDYGVGAIPVGYAELRNPDYIVSMPVFSYALRKSRFIEGYIKYQCPIDKHIEIKIFGDSTIDIYSKKIISSQIVDELNCEFRGGEAFHYAELI